MTSAAPAIEEALLAALEAGDIELASTLAERRARAIRLASAGERAVARGFDRALLEGCRDLLDNVRREQSELAALRTRLAALPRPKRTPRFIDRRA